MHHEPLIDFHHTLSVLIAVPLAFLCIIIARVMRIFFRYITQKIHTIIPRRISHFFGFCIAATVLFFTLNGILTQTLFEYIDTKYARLDHYTDSAAQKPYSPFKSGSNQSLVSWNSLGRQGRNFVSTGPTKEDIAQFTHTDATEPIRVYVGLIENTSIEERAQLALAELKRTHAFERSILIVTTPTGTGWMDPAALDTVEYLHGGDTAIVALQYSYLQSQHTLFVDAEKPKNAAKTLLSAVYNHWTTLPRDARPKLYLNGVSLGAFGSESSFEIHKMIDDPVNGALWAGSPFLSPLRADIIAKRNPDSPAWLPVYEDSTFIRFYGQNGYYHTPQNGWKNTRIIYLQNATDPISFFSFDLLYKKPAWLDGTRGPDVSPLLHWYPVITFFQILFDTTASVSDTPKGHGHNYAPTHYIDAWIDLTDPPHWTTEKTQRLRELFFQK